MQLGILFICSFAGLLILVVNLRAISHSKWLMTGVTEFVYALFNFVVVQSIMQAQTLRGALVYAAGATLGALVALNLTQHWDRKDTSSL